MSIDKNIRTDFAELIRHFISGNMSVDDYEEKVNIILFHKRSPDTKDESLNNIYLAIWSLYDDFRTNKMIGEWKVKEETKELCKIDWPLWPFRDENDLEWAKNNINILGN